MHSIAICKALSSKFYHGLGLAPGFLVEMLVLAACAIASVNSNAAWSSRLIVEVFSAFRISNCSFQEELKLLNYIEFSIVQYPRFILSSVSNRSQSARSILN